MRIHWKRGLFRIWLVLASLWITFAVLVSWQSIANPYVGTFAFVEGHGDTAWAYASPVASGAREAKIAGTMIEIEVEGAPTLSYFTTEADAALGDRMEHLATIMLGFQEARIAEVRPGAVLATAVLALAPPLAVLLLGSMIVWALLGFFGNTNATQPRQEAKKSQIDWG